MRVTEERVIELPLETVFSHLADIEGRVNWVTPAEVREKVTDGPVAAGSRFRSTDRLPFGRVTFDHEVTELVPNESISERWTGPLAGRSTLVVSPRDGGTLLSVNMEMAPQGIYRVLAALARPIIGISFRKDLDRFEKWAAGG